MISPVATCPACSARVPGPCYLRGRGSLHVFCRVCGNGLAVSRLPEVNEELQSDRSLGREIRIPGYELLGLLGQGGMGMVFSAVRESDHTLVALKMLPPDCLRYPELVARFEQEARLMAALSHPSIIDIHDMGRWNNHPFLVMDYIPGVSLREHIDHRAPLPLAETLAIAAGVGEAIQACHEAGLVHRDLKPGNVLLSQGGQVIVTDFGIANLLQRLGEQTDYGVSIGTPQYIAPEQLADGSKVDVRADQYSVAILIYEMLTRRIPKGSYRPIARHCPDVTSAADAVMARALSYRASDRFSSVREFLRALRKALPGCAEGPPAVERVRAAAAATCARLDERSHDDSPLPVGGRFHVEVLPGPGVSEHDRPAASSPDAIDRVAKDFQLPGHRQDAAVGEVLVAPRDHAPVADAGLPESRLAAPGGSRWIALAILGVVVMLGTLALVVRALVAGQ